MTMKYFPRQRIDRKLNSESNSILIVVQIDFKKYFINFSVDTRSDLQKNCFLAKLQA
jgi:hypothetical protein